MAQPQVIMCHYELLSQTSQDVASLFLLSETVMREGVYGGVRGLGINHPLCSIFDGLFFEKQECLRIFVFTIILFGN